ncbi:MAG: hypothetical protein Q4C53_08920 [Clostridia bacterium]|nr:hypothetical protein [Clostridia bacterium]
MTERKTTNDKTGEILRFIRTYREENGYGPTMREIGAAVGMRSQATVFNKLARMERDGLVTTIPGKHRSVRVAEPAAEEQRERPCAVLRCSFAIPQGMVPESVIAMVKDGTEAKLVPVPADRVELLSVATGG